ncbi:14561_t:CDS:2, partial [Racocetra fulgida]
QLWNISDADVPEWLESERNLIAIDEILRPILEDDSFTQITGAQKLYILTDMEYNNIILYFFDRHTDNSEFLNAVERFDPTILYFDEPLSVTQTIIRPRSGVTLHGIHSNGGGGVSAFQSADIIFSELDDSVARYDLWDLEIYLGDA